MIQRIEKIPNKPIWLCWTDTGKQFPVFYLHSYEGYKTHCTDAELAEAIDMITDGKFTIAEVQDNSDMINPSFRPVQQSKPVDEDEDEFLPCDYIEVGREVGRFSSDRPSISEIALADSDKTAISDIINTDKYKVVMQIHDSYLVEPKFKVKGRFAR